MNTEMKNGMKLQVNTRAGYVNYLNPDDNEMLLPTGYSLQANGQVETPLERQNRLMKKEAKANPKQAGDNEMLLPAGIQLEDQK